VQSPVEDPEFTEQIENITVPAGRNVKLACSVKNLGTYKQRSLLVRISLCQPLVLELVSLLLFDKMRPHRQSTILSNRRDSTACRVKL
ncbi:hypothetical protein L9F63_006030, partial [Diploptera punctata]